MQTKEYKYRVAVCLGGLFKDWDLSRLFFRQWENAYPDISFEYFISTWSKTWYSKIDNLDETVEKKWQEGSITTQGDGEVVDVTENSFIGDFNDGQLKDYDVVDPSRYSFSDHPHKWTFHLFNCNLLKTKYELENNFKYDLVFCTRPDMIFLITGSFKKALGYFLNGKKTDIDTLELIGGGNCRILEHRKFSDWDVEYDFIIGKSSTIDIVAGLYRYVYMNKKYNTIISAHSTLFYFMRYAGLMFNTSNIAIKKIGDSLRLTWGRPWYRSFRSNKKYFNDREWVRKHSSGRFNEIIENSTKQFLKEGVNND